MGSTEHLKPHQWKPGQTGNPNGAPKGKRVNISRRVREVLQTELKGKKLADILSEIMVREAVKNPVKMWPFIKDFMDRDEGPPERSPDDIEAIAASIRTAMKAMDETVPKPKPKEEGLKQT